MEFLESLPLLHLQQQSMDPDPPHHSKKVEFITKYENLSSNIKNQHEYYQDKLDEYIREGPSATSHNISRYYNIFSPSALYNSGHFGAEEATLWDLVTEETTSIAEAPSTFQAVTATQSVFDELPLRLPTWGIITLIIGYLLVFIFGIVGNCCVIFVVIRLRRMKTVTNFFIFSLAVADLLVLLFCLLPNLVSNIFVPWVLGWFLCKTVPYIQGLSVCSSVYFLVAISVERCISIKWPFKYKITKDKAKLMIIAIWLWSSIVALPWALFFESGNFDPENPHLEFCIEVWPDEYKEWSTYYFLFGNLIICYVFPLVVILLCYSTVWLRVNRRSIPSNCYQTAMEYVHQRSKTAVIKMLIVVVCIFALSWLPLYGIIIRIKFGGELGDTESVVIRFLYPIAQWLGCFNSCINPIIYSFLNVKFRKAFLSIIRNHKKQSQIKFKHKSPTVNILLQRLSSIQHRVETAMSNNLDSSETM